MRYFSKFFLSFLILSTAQCFGFWSKVEKRLDKAMAKATQEQINNNKEQIKFFLDACDPKYGWFNLFDFFDVEYFQMLAAHAAQVTLPEDKDTLTTYVSENTEWSQRAEDTILHYLDWVEQSPKNFIFFNTYLKMIFLCNYQELFESMKKNKKHPYS